MGTGACRTKSILHGPADPASAEPRAAGFLNRCRQRSLPAPHCTRVVGETLSSCVACSRSGQAAQNSESCGKSGGNVSARWEHQGLEIRVIDEPVEAFKAAAGALWRSQQARHADLPVQPEGTRSRGESRTGRAPGSPAVNPGLRVCL